MKNRFLRTLAGIVLFGGLALNAIGQNTLQESKDTTDYMRYRDELEKKYFSKQRDTSKQEIDTCTYIVQEGDKGYWDIARKRLGNEKAWKIIQDMNKGLKSEELKKGQKILIPCKIKD